MCVITQTAGDSDDFPLEIVRRPSGAELLRHVRWCDVFFQNNISLRTLWPLLFVRRPLVVAHQTWLDIDGRASWQSRAKRFVLRFARSVAISKAVAETLPVESIIVGNPYDDEIFKNLGSFTRTRDLIFIGRLVSDKGVDILIKALRILRDSSIQPQLTITGDGPERQNLERQTTELGLQSAIDFTGNLNSRQLAEQLNQHRILVVPSRWPEPFGIVALEAIACGCIVIGSEQGGLAEAIGPCGKTFPNGDAPGLAKILGQLLTDSVQFDSLLAAAEAHLALFKRRNVARRYLDVMETMQ